MVADSGWEVNHLCPAMKPVLRDLEQTSQGGQEHKKKTCTTTILVLEVRYQFDFSCFFKRQKGVKKEK